MNTCEHCRWWKKWDGDFAPHNLGNCHAGAPAHFPKLDPWPCTENTDFCGRFQLKPELVPRLPPPPDPPSSGGLQRLIDDLPVSLTDLEIRAIGQMLDFCIEQHGKSHRGYFHPEQGWCGAQVRGALRKMETARKFQSEMSKPCVPQPKRIAAFSFRCSLGFHRYARKDDGGVCVRCGIEYHLPIPK